MRSCVIHIMTVKGMGVSCVVVNVKARRKTATAEDLLFAGASDGSHLAATATPVISTRAQIIVDPAGHPALIPTRSAAVAEPRGSPPEHDYSLLLQSKSTTSRVNRCHMCSC